MRTVLLIAVLLLSGCATQAISTSEQASTARGAEQLTDYRLPRASLAIDVLAWGSDQFAVRVYQPTIVPDERFVLYANERPRMLSDDAIRIEVDPQTRLLRSINVVSQDQTAAILAQVGAMYGARSGLSGFDMPDAQDLNRAQIETLRDRHTTDACPLLGPTANPYGAPVQVAQTIFDPLDGQSIKDASDFLNARVAQYLRHCGVTENAEPVVLLVRRQDDGLWRPILPPSTATAAPSTSAPAPTASTPADPRQRPDIARACGDGICIPSATQIMVSVAAPHGGAAQALLSVPDADNLRVLHLDRALFVRNTTAAIFSNGSLGSVSVTRPSQALGVVTVPITVVRAVLGSVTEVFQLRVNISSQQRSIAGDSGNAATVPTGISTALPSVAEAASPAALAAIAQQNPPLLISAASFGVPASAYIPQPAQPKAAGAGAAATTP